MRKRLLIVVAMAALLGLQFADCMSAMTQNQQSLQCCASMPCDPSNQGRDCCNGMGAPQSPNALPISHVTLDPPLMLVARGLSSPHAVPIPAPSPCQFAAPPHSPP